MWGSRRFSLVLLFLAALGSLAFAQAQPDAGAIPPVPGEVTRTGPSANTPPAKTYTLSGTVVNSQTGEGIPHAMVQVGPIATMTDSNGSFSVEGMSVGSYFVHAEKPGYFDPPQNGRAVMGTPVGPDSQPVTVSLSPESVIYGRITDSDGLPVQHFNVQVMRSSVNEGRRDWQPMGTKQTDEDGYYRIAGLQPGTYLVVAGPSQIPSIGAMAKTGQQNSGYGQVFFPAPADTGTTGGIHISPGQKISADMSVDAEPFYSITGTVSAPQGTGVWINMTPRNNIHTDRGQAFMRGENNTFSIRMIPHGDYILHAGTQVNGKQWNAFVPLHVAGDIDGLPIVLEPSVSIPVTTRVERTRPNAANVAEVADVSGPIANGGRVAFQPPPVQVILRSLDNPQQQYWASFRPAQQAGESAKFAVDSIPPGTYKVDFRANGDLYVASARYGSTDLLRENLVVTHGSGPDPIDITLRDDGGKLKITVTSDGQKANGNLLIVPDHGAPFLPQGFSSNGPGEFNLQELRPASYSILAFDDLNELEYTNPNALEPYMSSAAHVDLTANQEASITLKLQTVGGQ